MIQARLLKSQPWRFSVGDTAYVRGWSATATVKIVSQLQSLRWPHYLAEDYDGNLWQLPQIHLSYSPIIDR